MSDWKRGGRACARLTVLAMLGVSLSGCTLVGAGVGAGINSLMPAPYEERPLTELVRLERNARVVTVLRNGDRVPGRYLGTLGPTASDLELYLLLSGDEKLVRVKQSDVASIAVEVTGKGWLYGGLIGLAVDGAIVVASGIALNHVQMDLSSDPNGLRF